MLPCFSCQVLVDSAPDSAIYRRRLGGGLPCVDNQTCARLKQMPLPASEACVKGVEKRLRGNLGGWLIGRARSGAGHAREGREAARIVVVRHIENLSVVLGLLASGHGGLGDTQRERRVSLREERQRLC